MSGLDHQRKRLRTTGASRYIAATTAGFAALVMLSTSARAAPEIRFNALNRVPACASPERLTAFLVSRNPDLDPRFRDIARWYKHWGEAWRVRWDYAFFQMIIETNALKFRRGDGRRGDVNEKQNNFAGIGATGGGVPGDHFPDIKTGVHAQIQHLVAYSGERLATPIAPRTEQQQDGIIHKSLRLRRAVTFGDLARRWAADRAYSRTIDAVAEQFRSGFCNTVTANAAATASPVAVPAPQPAIRKRLSPFPPPYRLGGPKAPKPSKLAGPEELPWANPEVMAREYDQSASQPVVNEPAAKPGTKSPVRTIWSRDGNTPDAAVQADRNVQPSQPDAAHANASVATPQSADEDAPPLPHFKIAPEPPAGLPAASPTLADMPPPSRLGGPFAAAPIMPTEPASPSARFKDIVLAPPAAAAEIPRNCKVLTASYGGKKTLLVRASVNGETRYTALTVLDGFEKSMFETFTKTSEPGAEIIGEYPTKNAALSDARANCSTQ